jgi:hypothetical protein
MGCQLEPRWLRYVCWFNRAWRYMGLAKTKRVCMACGRCQLLRYEGVEGQQWRDYT